MGRYTAFWAMLVLLLQAAGCPQPADEIGRSQPGAVTTYRVIVSVSGQGQVQSSAPSDTVQAGAFVTLTAMPDTGFRFARWEGTSTSAASFLAITVEKDETLTAVFEPIPPPDFDGDGIPNAVDNCLAVSNADQADTNGDGRGNACTPVSDFDGDGVDDDVDNCVFANPDQADVDGNGVGDACEPSFSFDFDNDGVDDSVDNCVFANPDQADSDGDGVGDACELSFDFDGDGIDDLTDNCVFVANADQADGDADGRGDACEFSSDFDQDGVEDGVDNCIVTPNPDQADSDLDGIGDACEIVVPPPPPGGDATIVAIYGGDAIELSDGSVWEVTFGFTIGWFTGDAILVQGSRLINLDEVEEVTANRLGQAVLHDRINSVSSGGEFLLLSGGTLWHINLLDRFRVAIWLPIQRVVVVQSSAFSYRIVRENNGQVVGATPATP